MHATKLRRATFEVEMQQSLNHRLLLPLLAFCLLGKLGVSQEQVMPPLLWTPSEYRVSGGYALPHRDAMHALVTGHAWSGSVIWGKHVEGGWASHGHRTGTWQGLELAGTYAGSEELGWIAHAIWLNRWPISGKVFSEFGLGLAWATSPFDAIEAPRSFALGSHANAALRINVGYAWSIRQLGSLQLAAGLTHFSNGSVALPNLGMNLIGVHCTFIPLEHQEKPRTKTMTTPPLTEQNRGLHFETTLRVGIRDTGLPGGVVHPTTSWMNSVHYRHRERHNWSWSAAFDLGFNQSLRVNGSPDAASDPSRRLQSALLIGARCHYGRMALTLMEGWMLTEQDKELGKRHLHTALQYAVTPDWRIELGLRSFRLRADSPFLGFVWHPRRLG
tara:strand:+ start:815 stop:1978 length:1164 start_codon:yes stop_codon:yes gene_type:complete